jgi:hypothetical protein
MTVQQEKDFPLVDKGPLFTRNMAQIAGFDGAYSIPLRDGRVLWYFGDTILGRRTPGTSLWYPDGQRIGNREMAGLGQVSGMVTNSGLAVHPDAQGRCDPSGSTWGLIVDTSNKPRELVPRQAREQEENIRVWCLQGIDLPEALYLFYQLVRIIPEDYGLPVCFEILGTGLAAGRPDSMDFSRLPGIPVRGDGLFFGPGDPQFAAAIVASGDWLYLYGVRKAGFSQQCCLARVKAWTLARAEEWRYWDGTGWSPQVADAVTLFEGPPNELSVSWNPYLNRWLAVHSIAMTGSIVARTAPHPEGPWSPETLLAGIQPDPERSLPYPFLVYAAKEHPELACTGGREIALTFVEFEEYWPHLLQIDLGRLA